MPSFVSQCFQIAGLHACQCAHLLVSQHAPSLSPSCQIAEPHARQCAHLLVFQYVPSCVSQCFQIAEPHACQCASVCLLVFAFIRLPVLPDRWQRIACSPARRHMKAHSASSPVCALPDCRAACLPVRASACFPARAFICLPVLRGHSAHKRIQCRRIKVFFLGAQACSLLARKSVSCWRISVSTVGAQECLSSAQRVHCRCINVFTFGAQACPRSAHKSARCPRASAPCRRIIVSSVGVHKCFLLARKRAHCCLIRLFLVGASSYPASAHTSVHCWRTSTLTVGAQECSFGA